MPGALRTIGCVCMLAYALVIAGCKDEEREQALAEAEEARLALVKVKTALSRANREITDLKEELAAVKETRNELQARIDQIIREHGSVVAEAGNAKERLRQLAAQSDDQAKSMSTVQSENAELKTMAETQQATIDEQKATIEELKKTIEELQGTSEDPQDIIEESEEPIPDG